MKVLTALVLGYLFGAKTAGKDLDQLGKSLKTLCETDEFADVVMAARSHIGHTLRELASMVDGDEQQGGISGDLVAQVRHLVEHRD